MELQHETDCHEALITRLKQSDPEWLDAQIEKTEDWEQKWAHKQGLLKPRETDE